MHHMILYQLQKTKTLVENTGLSFLEIEDFIYSLEKEDLNKGPVPDYDFPNEEVFIFKKEILPGVMFYVKVKEKNGQIKILSCHEDED